MILEAEVDLVRGRVRAKVRSSPGRVRPRVRLTLAIRLASWARFSSSQKMVGTPVARARDTARRTQSRIGSSLVWHIRQISPASTSCESRALPVRG
tara:strand:+ start:62 stop:349 length:288 start_codon:yes stop_codon:yes gene_type:complete